GEDAVERRAEERLAVGAAARDRQEPPAADDGPVAASEDVVGGEIARIVVARTAVGPEERRAAAAGEEDARPQRARFDQPVRDAAGRGMDLPRDGIEIAAHVDPLRAGAAASASVAAAQSSRNAA